MSKQFWFGGRSSREFGMMPTGAGFYNAPERDTERISVEGRNGDLIIDKGRYKNVPLQIPVSICKDFPEKAAAARVWLLRESGYQRLESDYDPEHYRMAAFVGPLDFDVKFLNRMAEATLDFTCKPQRFLKAGERRIAFEGGGTLFNPTEFPALPLIDVWGTGAGTLTVNGVSVELNARWVLLDCETQNAFLPSDRGEIDVSINMNHAICAPQFPVLQPGNNEISFGGEITNAEIIPRWWTL